MKVRIFNISRRLKFNLLSFFLSSLISIVVFMLMTLGNDDIIIVSAIVAPFIGGVVCGLLVYRPDWKFIGPLFLLTIVGVVVLLSRFFFPSWVWSYLFEEAGLSALIFGIILFAALAGMIPGYFLNFFKPISKEES